MCMQVCINLQLVEDMRTSTTVVVFPVPGGPCSSATWCDPRALLTAACWEWSRPELKGRKGGGSLAKTGGRDPNRI